MPARASVSGLVLLVLLASSCGGGAPTSGVEAEWRAGDGLLEEPTALALTSWPGSPTDAALLAVLSVLTDETVHRIPSERFADMGAVDAERLPGNIANTGRTWHHWVASTEVSLDPALGPLQLSLDGTPMELFRGEDAEQVMFVVPERDVGLSWRIRTGQLHAYSPDRPGSLEVRRVRDAESVERERRLRRVRPLDEVVGLLGEHLRAGELRHGLRVPAGAALRGPPRVLRAERLEFSVSHEGEAWQLRDGAPVLHPAAVRGVTAEWVVHADSGESVAWRRDVEPGETFAPESVDLSGWTGQRVALELRLSAAGEDSLEELHLAGLRFAGGEQRRPSSPHLVFIDLDTLRADRLGVYGNTPSPSPALDAWAAEHATVFEDCTSTSDWTLPSTVSLLTGLAPTQHGLMAFPDAMSPAHEPLAQRLLAAGYETRARTDAGVLNPAFGFHLGFETFDFRRLEAAEHERVGFSPELEWLAARRSERPVFLFLQTYMIHDPFRTELLAGHPYDGPLAEEPLLLASVIRTRSTREGLSDADASYLRELYDAGIARMDALLADTLARLPRIFGDDPYLVLITSDHGEELLDRGGAGHGRSLYQELVHVPLIVRFADGRAPARVDAPVSGLDVAPTLLEAAGLAVPESFPGRSLRHELPADRLRVARHLRNGEMHAAVWRGHKLIRRSERTPELKLLPGGAEAVLYDLGEDPGERHDLVETNAREADALRTGLERYLEELPPVDGLGEARRGAIDDELRRDLRALGYLEDG